MRRMFLLPLVMLACAPPVDTKNHIVIGAVLDRTGINSELSWGDAVALAQAHVNRALDEMGYKNLSFKVPIRDSAGIADTAIAEATKLVNIDGAKGLIVASSEETVGVHKLYYDADPANDLKVPLMCSSCTSSSINIPTATHANAVQQLALRNSEKWLYRSIMSTKLIAKVLAATVLKAGDTNGDGKLKVSVYFVDDSFGIGAKNDIINEIKAQLPASGLTVPFVSEEVIHAREVDTNSYPWSQDVAKLVDTYNETTATTDGLPDMVVSANLVIQESAFTRAYNESGTAIRNLHFHTMRASSALRAVAQLAEGEEGVSHLLLENDASGQLFKKDYENAFGTPIVYRDSIYYDAAMMLLLGTVQATIPLDDPTKVTGAQVRDAMQALSTNYATGTIVRTGTEEVKKALAEMIAGRAINYQGASGPLDQDANFNIRSKLASYRVVNGVFVDEKIYDCVTSTDCPLISQ